MYDIRNPQTGIATAAPNDDAIMLAMNFERSMGLIQTAVIGWMAGQLAPKNFIERLA